MRLAASLALAGLLLVPGALDARQHHPARGHRILPAAAALDGFTQPTFAYSFRKLRTAYAGNAARVRRVSDSIELNIGFLGSGDWDNAAALAHCTATPGACTVVTMFDQSGNARDATEGVAKQPVLLFNCVNGQPCLRANAAGTAELAGPYSGYGGVITYNVVANHHQATSNCTYIYSGELIGANSANTVTLFNGSASLTAAATDNAWHSVSGVINGASSAIRIDGTETTGTLAPVAGAGMIIGGMGTTALPCSTAEYIVWYDVGLTAAQRTALADNQRNYYTPYTLDAFAAPAGAYSMRKLKSTYTGPAIRIRRASDNAETDINFLGYVPGLGSPIDYVAANTHCAATSCFVVTMYDQSGNARHVTQATAGNQPAYVANCIGTLPCARVSGAGQGLRSASVAWAAAKTSLSTVGNRSAGFTVQCNWVTKGSNNVLVANTLANGWYLSDLATATIPVTAADAAWHAGIGVIDGAGTVVRIDATETTGSITGVGAAGEVTVLGDAGAATCSSVEAVVWDNYALTGAERTALTANQRSFWGF